MKRKLLVLLLISGLVVLAAAGWTVKGLRWALASSMPRGVPQPA
jgi:hypothetical protein